MRGPQAKSAYKPGYCDVLRVLKFAVTNRFSALVNASKFGKNRLENDLATSTGPSVGPTLAGDRL